MYLSLFRLRLPEYNVLLFFCARRLVWSLRCSPSRESLLMLPFAYSLGLPLLAGGIPPTWSLVSGTTPDLSTNEAAGTLYLGTRSLMHLSSLQQELYPPLGGCSAPGSTHLGHPSRLFSTFVVTRVVAAGKSWKTAAAAAATATATATATEPVSIKHS